ncbi:hypothetical protein DAI22_07g138950 [Oryza sativa Japonica Group]|nr:hypothetical protein DAI22_07g138950 [Oryza sativa Japonica Group]
MPLPLHAGGGGKRPWPRPCDPSRKTPCATGAIHPFVLPRPTAAQSLPLWLVTTFSVSRCRHTWSAQMTLAGTAYLTVLDRHDGLCC